MARGQNYNPGSDRVPVTGVYSLVNADGHETQTRVPAIGDTIFPVAPTGWTWKLDPREQVAA